MRTRPKLVVVVVAGTGIVQREVGATGARRRHDVSSRLISASKSYGMPPSSSRMGRAKQWLQRPADLVELRDVVRWMSLSLVKCNVMCSQKESWVRWWPCLPGWSCPEKGLAAGTGATLPLATTVRVQQHFLGDNTLSRYLVSFGTRTLRAIIIILIPLLGFLGPIFEL